MTTRVTIVPVVLSLLLLVSSADPRQVVRGYLDALRDLDQDRMDAYCAPDLVWVGADGSERKPPDPAAAREMRAFERGMNTVWTYRLLEVDGERISVEMTEQNDFYERLGVSRRTQREVYVVRQGRIHRMETKDMRHERGDYRTEYARFKEWLLSTPAASDPDLVRDGGLRFDATSAKRMRPWLEKWRRQHE
jgi:ketosteroid isomerase-like protein